VIQRMLGLSALKTGRPMANKRRARRNCFMVKLL
jgi:hypothetical protein